MKITATKDFGHTKNNKIVLPLVPEPTETVTKKEDLATVNLYSDPTDTDSTKVRFAFKTLNGSAPLGLANQARWIINHSYSSLANYQAFTMVTG